MKDALLCGELAYFGELLGGAWKENTRLSPLIATPFILEVYEEALSKVAAGGKVTGAGSGGHVLFYCDFERKHKVAEALIAMGATVADFNFDSKGLVTWR